MAQMDTIHRTHDDRNLENRGTKDQTALGKLADKVSWWNEPARNKYTIGAALRKMLHMEPSEHGFHTTRGGRLVERIVTLGASAFILSTALSGIAVLPVLLMCAKIGGTLVGHVAAESMKGVEGVMRKIDRHQRKPDIDIEDVMDRVGLRRSLHEDNSVGARFSRKNEQKHEVGARETAQRERPEDGLVGTREFKDTSIQTSFQTVASRTFDPSGPRPRENFDLPGNGAPAKKPGQAMGA